MPGFIKRSDRKNAGQENGKGGRRPFWEKERSDDVGELPVGGSMTSPFDTEEGRLFQLPPEDNSGGFDPVPETRADVEHQIHPVQTEHSEAEGAPAQGSKFDDAAEPQLAATRKFIMPDFHGGDGPAHPETDTEKTSAEGAVREADGAAEEGPGTADRTAFPVAVPAQDAVSDETKRFGAPVDPTEETRDGSAGQLDAVERPEPDPGAETGPETKADPAQEGDLARATEKAKSIGRSVLGKLPKKKRARPGIDASPEALVYPEYTSADNIDQIKAFLFKEKKFYFLRLCVCGVCALAAAAISLIAELSPAEQPTLFAGSGTVYISLMMLLLLVGCAPMAKEFSGVLRKAPKKIFGADAAVIAMWSVVLIHDLVMFTAPEKVNAPCRLYNAAALAVTFAVGAIRLITLTRTAAGFRILISKKEKRAIGSIRDRHRSERIGSGLLASDAKIGYAFRTGFIENYINAMLTDDPSAALSTRLLPFCLGGSFLLAVVAGIVSKDLHTAFGAFAALTLVTVPLPANIALHIMRNNANAKLEYDGGVIPNYAGARAFAANDALIYDAAELFDSRSSDVLGMRSFNGFNEYQAIVYAAAMLMRLGCPLGDLFNKVIGGETDLLPKTDTLQYEDRQGISGWIDEKIVLLGGRQMMNNHNIEVLTAEKEMKYINANPDRRIFYLAVEGRVVAMFLAAYRLEKKKAQELNYLSRHGYTLLLHSTDQNINDTFTERQLSLKENSVKIIGPEAADYFKLCRTESIPDAGTRPFTSGRGLVAVLRLQVAAVKLQNAYQITQPLTIAGIALGAIVTTLLFMFGSASSVTGLFTVFLPVLWTAICVGVCRMAEKK